MKSLSLFAIVLLGCSPAQNATSTTINPSGSGGSTQVGNPTGGTSSPAIVASIGGETVIASTTGQPGTTINPSGSGGSTELGNPTGGTSSPATAASTGGETVIASTTGEPGTSTGASASTSQGTGGSSTISNSTGGTPPGTGGSSATSNSTGGTPPGTGGSSATSSSTGGTPPGTGGSSTTSSSTGGTALGTGGATQIADPNFTPFPACTDTPDDPTCSPAKASVQGNGTCPDINLPDYQTAVQIATHQSPSTDPCTLQIIQNWYKYIVGSGTSAYTDCVSDPNSRSSCLSIIPCWQCLINSHSLMGGAAGYWFNYTVFYSTNSCSKIVWNLGDCLQQACSDVTSQKDYASCAASAQLPATLNVPKSGLCYQAFGAASIAIFNEVPADQLDVTSEKGWEYYAGRLCGN